MVGDARRSLIDGMMTTDRWLLAIGGAVGTVKVWFFRVKSSREMIVAKQYFRYLSYHLLSLIGVFDDDDSGVITSFREFSG